jgi:hypothetical protein
MVDGFKSGQHLVGRGTGQIGVGSITQTQKAAIEELVYSTDSQGSEYEFSGADEPDPQGGQQPDSRRGDRVRQQSALRAEQSRRSAESADELKYAPELFFFDFNPVIGGPIEENKLWYFGSVSGNRSNSQILDVYFKPDEPSTPEHCRNRAPDNLCQADTGAVLNWSETIRVTYQLSSKQKRRYSFDNTRSLGLRGNYITGGAKESPEASWRLPLYPAWLAQVKYTAPLTNRLLVEGGYSYQRGDFRVLFQPENAPYAMAKWDLLRGTIEENHYLSYSNTEKKEEAKASVAYVTGSYSLKVGFTDRWATALQANPFNGDMSTLVGSLQRRRSGADEPRFLLHSWGLDRRDQGHALSRTSQFNPIFQQTDTRSWTDLNGDGRVINTDGTPQYAEIGPPTNARFGTLQGIDRLDPNLIRDKNWTYELTGQHELFPRISVSAGYYHRPVFRSGVHGQSGDDRRRLDPVHLDRSGGLTAGHEREDAVRHDGRAFGDGLQERPHVPTGQLTDGPITPPRKDLDVEDARILGVKGPWVRIPPSRPIFIDVHGLAPSQAVCI